MDAMGVVCSMHRKTEMRITFSNEQLKRRDHWGNVGVDRIILKWILQAQDMTAWTLFN
jgi:hypothetical protein